MEAVRGLGNAILPPSPRKGHWTRWRLLVSILFSSLPNPRKAPSQHKPPCALPLLLVFALGRSQHTDTSTNIRAPISLHPTTYFPLVGACTPPPSLDLYAIDFFGGRGPFLIPARESSVSWVAVTLQRPPVVPVSRNPPPVTWKRIGYGLSSGLLPSRFGS